MKRGINKYFAVVIWVQHFARMRMKDRKNKYTSITHIQDVLTNQYIKLLSGILHYCVVNCLSRIRREPFVIIRSVYSESIKDDSHYHCVNVKHKKLLACSVLKLYLVYSTL